MDNSDNPVKKREIFGWAFFDFANSSYVTVVITAIYSSFFVKYVIPELQKRGIYRKEYSGSTLRDHLGLNRPNIGDWRGTPQAAE